MTKLLVSVRSLEEAEKAADGGADIIDIKEPQNGSLGAAPMNTIKAIADGMSCAVPISAALGELTELESNALCMLPAGLSFAKIGLAGCENIVDWQSRLRHAWSSSRNDLARVAVAYADWQSSKSPNPQTVATVGSTLKCTYFLLDTQSKSRPLLDLVTTDQLDQWFDAARNVGMKIVVAGSLEIRHFEHVIRRWSPDILAVRGAACEGARTDAISEQKVRQLKAAIGHYDITVSRR